MIRVDELEMYYGSFKALDRVSFEVKKGEVVGLLGPNGAGKSTTMKVLTTFLYPHSGKATVAGMDVTTNPIEVRSKIGYLPEILPLYLDMEVKDYLHFIASARLLSRQAMKERTEWVIHYLGLKPVYRKLCRELSKGFRQRVGLAQALIHDPEIVILDEPTSGLDPHQIKEIRDLIRILGKTKTVILSTHILQEVEATSDRIVIINRGRIVGDGTAGELYASAGFNERTFVSVKAPKDHAASAFGAIGGVLHVKHLSESDGYNNYEIHANRNTKLWNKVGEIVKDRGWQPGMIKDIPYTLEATFMALTSKVEKTSKEELR